VKESYIHLTLGRADMPREGYQEQLTGLREDVLYMSEVVLERLRMGLEALAHKDEALAWDVIEGDDEINRLYLELESDCIDLLALQQPVASDLRFIAASFKIITDLERIADLATNLGDYTLEARQDMFPDVDVQSIGERVTGMVEESMRAYEQEDPDACLAIAERDDDVDDRCGAASETVVRDLIEREVDENTDETAIEQLMADVSRLLLTIRDLERVGDHAVNIAARALYMVENDDELIY
jgi:phosphate transport system protein